MVEKFGRCGGPTYPCWDPSSLCASWTDDSSNAPLLGDPEKVGYKVIGVEMKGMESSMKLVALGATQRRG